MLKGPLLLLFFAVIAFAMICGAWTGFRAIARKLGIADTYRYLAVSVICVAPIGYLTWELTKDYWLDELEKTCSAELAKMPQMAGVANVVIREHFDFWNKTISGGGLAVPWVSDPYHRAQVWLTVDFTRDGEKHSQSIECFFSKLPNTGNPPKVAFEEVHFGWGRVRPEDLPPQRKP
jgi:hypothetical protein